MVRRRRVQLVVLALCVAALAGGGWLVLARAAGPKVDYRGTGVVEAILPPPSDLHATRPVILIHHDPVPDLMNESMSMPFIAASTDLFRGIHVGDRIAFGMQVTPDALLVVTITRRP
jgi:Cu/Ag efflux protein CusF